MNKCKDCKFWRENELTEYDVKRERKVCGDCSCKKFTYQDDKRFLDGLDYWDYEGYSAGFTTGPQFGCIHWEKKDD